MRALLCLVVVGSLATAAIGQLPTLESSAFPRSTQTATLTATVRIWNAAQRKEGSGVLVGKGGPFAYILTAHHVVEGAERVDVTVFSPKSYPKPQAVLRADVVARAKGLADLAMLRLVVADDLPPAVRLCPEGKVAMGDALAVLSAGCADGKPPTPLEEKAVKKRVRRPPATDTSTFWEVDRIYASGRSGGPLVDTSGRVVGICSGTNRDKTYFVHVEEIHSFLRKNGFHWLLEGKDR